MKSPYRSHLIIIFGYILLTLFLTWPIAGHLTTHIPGEATWAFDESTFIWNMWWFKHSILNLQTTPLESTYTFYPLGINLTTYTFNLFNAALGLPLQLAFSLPVASNLALLFSYVSSAYGTYLLVLYLLHRPTPSTPNRTYSVPIIPVLAAFAAGAVYAFSASRMMYVALGHYNFVTIQWFPFYTLFLLKALRGRSIKDAILAGLFAAFCIYAELTYSVFLLFITAILLIGEFVARRAANESVRATLVQFIKPLIFMALVAFVFTAPFILAVLPNFLDPAYTEPGWGEGLKLSADLAGLFTVTPLHPLSGLDWVTELRAVIEGNSRFSDANTLFLGYGILALALLGFITHRKATRVWFWSAIIFAILSLGPLLTINGKNRFDFDGIETTFPLPFTLLHYIPVLSANRVPNRFGIPLTLSLAVLVGFGIAWLLIKTDRKVEKRSGEETKPHSPSPITNPTSHITKWLFLALMALFLVILLFDQYSAPLPVTDARIPEAYYQIGAEPDDFAIMQLPLGWRNSYGTLGAERTQLQYFQAAHQRPMLGGNTSRNPAFKFDYFANIPLFAAITEAELYRAVDEATLAQAQQQAVDVMTLYNVKYLAIHDPIPHRKPYEDTYAATRDLALSLIPHQPEPVYQSPGVQVYAVQQADIPNPLTLDFGDWSSTPYRAEGWAGNEEIFAATANWATAPEATLFFPVRGSGDRQLSLHIAPFSYPGMPEQQVDLLLNGQALNNSYSLREGWQQIDVTLPEAVLVNGLNRLTLQFAHTAQPRQVLPANTAIGSTGFTTPTDLEVNSGAEFAFITVGFGDETTDASAHRRGVNVVIIDPQSGHVVEFKGFDTAANEFEAAALNQFIATVPEGYIVILATQGLDATAFFNADTAATLQTIGLSGDLPDPPFSAIGVKGATPGSVAQASGEGTAYLRLGQQPDTRNLAAAVDKVVISTPE